MPDGCTITILSSTNPNDWAYTVSQFIFWGAIVGIVFICKYFGRNKPKKEKE